MLNSQFHRPSDLPRSKQLEFDLHSEPKPALDFKNYKHAISAFLEKRSHQDTAEDENRVRPRKLCQWRQDQPRASAEGLNEQLVHRLRASFVNTGSAELLKQNNRKIGIPHHAPQKVTSCEFYQGPGRLSSAGPSFSRLGEKRQRPTPETVSMDGLSRGANIQASNKGISTSPTTGVAINRHDAGVPNFTESFPLLRSRPSDLPLTPGELSGFRKKREAKESSKRLVLNLKSGSDSAYQFQFEDELDLSSSCSDHSPKVESRDASALFSRNIIIKTQQKRQTKYVRKKMPEKPSSFKYRYHNIYKNFLRDIKVFYKTKFELHRQRLKDMIQTSCGLSLGYHLNEAVFNFFLVDFCLKTFDHSLVELVAHGSSEAGEERRVSVWRHFIYKVGCYLASKSMLVRFQPQKEPQSSRFKEKIEDILELILNQNQHRRLFQAIVQITGQGAQRSDKAHPVFLPSSQGGQLKISFGQAHSASFALPALTPAKNAETGSNFGFNSIKSSQEALHRCVAPSSEQPGLLRGTWKQAYTIDFYGELKSQSVAQRKHELAEIYKVFYRFSVDKLFTFVDEPALMALLLQYMGDTQMRRCHQMISLKLNAPCYYRAAENLINSSKSQSLALAALSEVAMLTGIRWEAMGRSEMCRNDQSKNSEKIETEVVLTLQELFNEAALEADQLCA